MAKDSNSYTLRRPPDWLIAGVVVLMGGGLGFAGTRVAGGDTATHNVEPDAHPAMLSEISHLDEEVTRLREKLDVVHNNQLVMCTALKVECVR